MTHTTSLNRAGSSTTNTSSQPYKDRGKQAFAHKWKSSLPADENRQASKTSIPLHRRYSASSQQGKCCEHEVPSSARLDRMVACCPIYTQLSCSSGGRGWGCGWGGGGVWSELSQMGWGCGGGVYFLSFSLQVTYTNNITLLVLKYLLIYSKLCYDEFHIYSPNFAKKIFKYIHAKQRKCC